MMADNKPAGPPPHTIASACSIRSSLLLSPVAAPSVFTDDDADVVEDKREKLWLPLGVLLLGHENDVKGGSGCWSDTRSVLVDRRCCTGPKPVAKNAGAKKRQSFISYCFAHTQKRTRASGADQYGRGTLVGGRQGMDIG